MTTIRSGAAGFKSSIAPAARFNAAELRSKPYGRSFSTLLRKRSGKRKCKSIDDQSFCPFRATLLFGLIPRALPWADGFWPFRPS